MVGAHTSQEHGSGPQKMYSKLAPPQTVRLTESGDFLAQIGDISETSHVPFGAFLPATARYLDCLQSVDN
jgi:hypothetical protein